jgi:flagellar basal body P-ring formation protein FlgA
VDGPDVFLRDVARPVGEVDHPAWERLAEVRLFPAPEQGRKLTIGRDSLAPLLQKALGPNARLALISNQLVIQRGGRAVLQEELLRKGVDYLTPKLRSLSGETTLRDWNLPGYVFLEEPGGALDFELGAEMAPGRQTLRILETAPGGKSWKRFTASVFVDLWVTVPAAARPLERGEVLGPDMVAFARVNLAFTKAEPWDGKSFGVRLTHALGQGQPITLQDLEDAPLVSKGAKLTLVFSGHTVQLKAPVVAITEGRVGQSITVQNLQSGRQVLARIQDAGTVVVQ